MTYGLKALAACLGERLLVMTNAEDTITIIIIMISIHYYY